MEITYKPNVAPMLADGAAKVPVNPEIPVAAAEAVPVQMAETLTPEEQLTQTLLSYGYKATAKNKEMLRLMLDAGIPLTKENVGKMNQAAKLTGTPQKALFLMQNNMRMTEANAAQLEGFASGQTKISAQINNLLAAINDLQDPQLAAQLKKIIAEKQPTQTEQQPQTAQKPQPTQPTPQTLNSQLSTLNSQSPQQTTPQAPAQTQTQAAPQLAQQPTPQTAPPPANSQPQPAQQQTPQSPPTPAQQAQPITNPTTQAQPSPAPPAAPTQPNPPNSQLSTPNSQLPTTLPPHPQKTPETPQDPTIPAKIPQQSTTPQPTLNSQLSTLNSPPSPLLFPLENSTPQAIEKYLFELREVLREVQTALAGRETPDAARVLSEARTLEAQVDFTQQIRNQTYVQLPLFHNGQQTQTSLHVYRDAKKSGSGGGNGESTSALIALDTAALGHFETYVQKNARGINCQFRLESDEIVAAVRNNIHKLSDLLAQSGYSLDSFSFLPPGEAYTVLDSPKTITHPNAPPGEIPHFDRRV